MKQKAYQANLHLGPKTHDRPQYDTSGWTIELIRKGDLWTWKATKGKAVLKAGREFESISIAKKEDNILDNSYGYLYLYNNALNEENRKLNILVNKIIYLVVFQNM